MGDDSVLSGDTPELQDVLDALTDPDCRAILRQTAEPMTANELTDTCDISRSTLYRKLDLLSSASLVREQDSINPGGGRTTRYERNFEDVGNLDERGTMHFRGRRRDDRTKLLMNGFQISGRRWGKKYERNNHGYRRSQGSHSHFR